MSNDSGKRTLTRRFVANLASILTSDILNKGTTFLIYILVARELGTYAFGQMSLALTLFYSFQVVAAFGMQTLVTREVAKDETNAARYFVCSFVVGLATSLASMVLLVGAVVALDYPVPTRDIILLTALGLVPFAIGSTCEAVIRGWQRMHLIAVAQVPVNLLKLAATYFVIKAGGAVFQVVAIIVISRYVIALFLFFMVVQCLRPWKSNPWDATFAWSIAKRSTTFVGIDTVTAWWTGLNIVLLSKLTTETDVGLYNAAAQLMIPMGIFYQSVMISAFPIMCRKYSAAKGDLKQVSNRLMELLMIMAIPGTVGLFMIASPALEFVYESGEFTDAAIVVRITAFVLVLKAMTFAFGHILLAGSREMTTFRIVGVNLVFNLILGWVLIVYFGLLGAAVAALLTRVVDVVQHYRPVKSVVSQVEFGTVIWKPLLASAAMATHLYLFSEQYLPVLILSAVVVYFAALMVLEVTVAGGFRNLKARLQ